MSKFKGKKFASENKRIETAGERSISGLKFATLVLKDEVKAICWMLEPTKELGNKRPIDFCRDSNEGLKKVKELLRTYKTL